jgi:benzil reductase ((S)-benzoin forming)
VRPGFIDTPSVRLEAEADPSTYPIAGAMRSGLEAGEADSPEEAARRIWAALPPPPGETVLLFGAVPSGTRPGRGDQS